MSVSSTYTWKCDVCDKEVSGPRDVLPRGWSQLTYEVTLGCVERHQIDVCEPCWPQEHKHPAHKKTVFKAFMQRLAKAAYKQDTPRKG